LLFFIVTVVDVGYLLDVFFIGTHVDVCYWLDDVILLQPP